MSKGVFITGTDTGIGKTFVSAALLALLSKSGVDVVPMKPVQSGCVRKGDDLVATDLEFCLKAAGYVPTMQEKMLMCEHKFEHACSPHLASKMAGVEISLERIKDDYVSLSAMHELVIVEGAGGVMVPISSSAMMLDLMLELGLSVILVARAGLGTINHCLLSLKVLKDSGLDVMGVILNEAVDGAAEYIVADNTVVIEKHGDVPVLGCLRHVDNFSESNGVDVSDKWMDELNPMVRRIKKEILK